MLKNCHNSRIWYVIIAFYNTVGKRSCLGESLAKNTYFLFTTALIKNFRLEAIPNEPMPSVEPTNGFTLGYEGFKAIAVPRK